MSKKAKSEPTPAPEPSARRAYFVERMAALGINPEKVPSFSAWYEGGTLGTRQLIDCPYFECMANGAIQINYPAIGQRLATYIEGGQEKEFRRWRNTAEYLKANPTAPKYGQPRASGVQVFLAPSVLQAVATTEQLGTIVLVEGEFKAMSLDLIGIPAIGLAGIYGYKIKGAYDMHPVIREVILTTRPERIIYLHDADATAAPWADWARDPETDLGKRLESFTGSVMQFRKAYEHGAPTLYYGHPKASWIEVGPKGIDDVLAWKKANAAPDAAPDAWATAIREQFNHPRGDAQDFDFIDLGLTTGSRIRQHFNTNRANGGIPLSFYMAHADRLGEDTEFVFNGGRYLFDGNKNELILTKHEDAEKFIRVGTDYYKEVYEPNPKGKPERKLRPWAKGEIQQDYVKEKGLKEFLQWIPKCDTFCNVPDNGDTYRLIHEVNGSRSYNLYTRLSHRPEPGTWEGIERFIRHIWGESYEMGLDYLQLMYQRPTQPLPIIGLVSKANGTGKSTWLKFIEKIFQENATIIGNDEITDRFNGDYASKLFIGVDEGLIEKKATVEKIKSWATADKINIDSKHAQRHRVGFFAKIGFTSNNEDTFLPIDAEDTRFLIKKVPVMDRAKRVSRLEDALEAEIPAFLHYLGTRTLHYPEKGRLYFDDALLETEEKVKLIANSKDWCEQEFLAWVRDQFLDTYLAPELYFTGEEMLSAINDRSSVKFRRHAFTRMLQDTLKLTSRNSTYAQPVTAKFIRTEFNNMSATTERKQGRCYTLRAEQFLSPTELDELRQSRAELLPAHLRNATTAHLEPLEPTF